MEWLLESGSCYMAIWLEWCSGVRRSSKVGRPAMEYFGGGRWQDGGQKCLSMEMMESSRRTVLLLESRV